VTPKVGLSGRNKELLPWHLALPLDPVRIIAPNQLGEQQSSLLFKAELESMKMRILASLSNQFYSIYSIYVRG